MLSVTFRAMTPADHPAFMNMMKATTGVVIRKADEYAAVARYLNRNPGMSHLAFDGDQLVGCAMSGHDGKRGYLQHVMTAPQAQGQGIARTLVDRCLEALSREGIDKVHLDTLHDNHQAHRFWERLGWSNRNAEIVRFSRLLVDDPNA
ncbi:GNAT family N-acetyltransferase [Cobetia crustatorum]|uniref:GNAT family N-acetyltransferase n=1 Tax=Cobetia crustatorum TaxID=553385 RepID=UPI0004695664|nr:GNAT family N-acetyltransferase [Cobetia crustatorum]